MMGGHLFPGPAVQHGHLFGSHTQAGPGRIHTRIPIADNQNLFPDLQFLTHGGADQQIQGMHNPRQVFPFQAQTGGLPGPQGHENGLISFFP